MRGIHFPSLLKNWDIIVDKLCEEISTHDVLLCIKENLLRKRKELAKNKYNVEKIDMSIKKLEEILKLIDPEQF